MGAILIRCPTTDQLVPVGIDTDKDSFDALPNVEARAVRCPHCGKDHTWSREDAILGTTCRRIRTK
jgi:hypothetical protein